jgi:hypothetical protein
MPTVFTIRHRIDKPASGQYHTDAYGIRQLVLVEDHTMNTLTRWVPRLITGTAIIHLTYGVVVPTMTRALGEIANAGFVASVGGYPEREAWLWFMLTGVSWLGLGELARWSLRETGRLPASLGAWLLAVAVPLTIAEPASGGWLVSVIGLLALFSARNKGLRINMMNQSPASRLN